MVSIICSQMWLDLIVLKKFCQRRILCGVSENVTGISCTSHLCKIIFIVDVSNVITHVRRLSLGTIALQLGMSICDRRMYDISSMSILYLIINGEVIVNNWRIQVFLLDALFLVQSWHLCMALTKLVRILYISRLTLVSLLVFNQFFTLINEPRTQEHIITRLRRWLVNRPWIWRVSV